MGLLDKMGGYKNLIVWQQSVELVKKIYDSVLPLIPIDEKYALTSQIRRSAISIPSNIAEGQSRNSSKEFIKFLYIAKGSKSELETQLYLVKELNYCSEEQIDPIITLCESIGKQLVSLVKQLEQ